jgi:hypothetical protein
MVLYKNSEVIMTVANTKFPNKGGGEKLRKIYAENRKKSKPNKELLEILEQQKLEEEKNNNKKSAVDNDLGV